MIHSHFKVLPSRGEVVVNFLVCTHSEVLRDHFDSIDGIHRGPTEASLASCEIA